MNLSRAALALGLNQGTLKNWLANPLLLPYFSDQAKREGLGRDLNDDDIIVINTIRKLRAGLGNSNVDWAKIADELAHGYRHQELPPEAATVDARITVAEQYRQMATVLTERDTARARVDELEQALKDEQQLRHSEAERLLRELADQRERATRAEVELELWRSGRIKPE